MKTLTMTWICELTGRPHVWSEQIFPTIDLHSIRCHTKALIQGPFPRGVNMPAPTALHVAGGDGNNLRVSLDACVSSSYDALPDASQPQSSVWDCVPEVRAASPCPIQSPLPS